MAWTTGILIYAWFVSHLVNLSKSRWKTLFCLLCKMIWWNLMYSVLLYVIWKHEWVYKKGKPVFWMWKSVDNYMCWPRLSHLSLSCQRWGSLWSILYAFLVSYAYLCLSGLNLDEWAVMLISIWIYGAVCLSKKLWFDINLCVATCRDFVQTVACLGSCWVKSWKMSEFVYDKNCPLLVSQSVWNSVQLSYLCLTFCITEMKVCMITYSNLFVV